MTISAATIPGIHGRGVIGSRPTAGQIGALYISTDETNSPIWYRDNGASWDNVTPPGGAGGGPAGELGYAQITGSITTASTSAVDASGLTTTVTIGSRKVVVNCFVPFWGHTVANAEAVVSIVDVTAGTTIQSIILFANASGNGQAVYGFVRVSPAAGSRTYKLQFYTITAGTLTLDAASNNAASIQVIEV